MQANAAHKKFVPIEVFRKPEDYKRWIRSLEQEPENPIILFLGEPRSNQTHVFTTHPYAKLANKWNGTVVMVGGTVN